MKLHIKGKPKEPSKRNHVPVLTSKKDRRDIDDLCVAQSIAKHTGTIWSMKFSHDGARLASGGQDAILRVWKVAISSNEDSVSSARLENGEKCIIEPEPEQSYQVRCLDTLSLAGAKTTASHFEIRATQCQLSTSRGAAVTLSCLHRWTR
jgi:WD40 repeat protein